jgi:hypothetical protein
MRIIDYDSFTREKREKFFPLKAILGRKRAARRRKRDKGKRDRLMIVDRNRFLRWISEGALEVPSPRHFVVRLTSTDFDRPA